MFAPLLCTLLAGNTWYVDVHATAPGNGTQAAPYTSIQYALAQAATADGDTLLVAPGIYVENAIFTKRVLVEGTGGALATHWRSAGSGFVALSRAGAVAGPEPWAPTIRGFTIDGAGDPAGTGVGTDVASAFLLLQRCIVTGFMQGLAVHQDDASDMRLELCTIAGNLYGLLANGFGPGGIVSYGCIVRGNGMDVLGANSSYEFYSCCVPPPLVSYGLFNFSGPPEFWDLPGGDLHLKPLSACVDSGSTWFLPPDPDGSPPDVGALPWDPLHAPFPASYCTPKTNSLGCAVSITSTGSASSSGPDNFFLAASSVLNNKPGLFLWSGGPKSTPFAGATLCLNPPLVRGTPLASGGSPSGSDCTGVFQWHFSQAYMASKGIQAGAILYAQAWGRDPGFAPPNNAQLSDARVFPVGP